MSIARREGDVPLEVQSLTYLTVVSGWNTSAPRVELNRTSIKRTKLFAILVKQKWLA